MTTPPPAFTGVPTACGQPRAGVDPQRLLPQRSPDACWACPGAAWWRQPRPPRRVCDMPPHTWPVAGGRACSREGAPDPRKHRGRPRRSGCCCPCGARVTEWSAFFARAGKTGGREAHPAGGEHPGKAERRLLRDADVSSPSSAPCSAPATNVFSRLTCRRKCRRRFAAGGRLGISAADRLRTGSRGGSALAPGPRSTLPGRSKQRRWTPSYSTPGHSTPGHSHRVTQHRVTQHRVTQHRVINTGSLNTGITQHRVTQHRSLTRSLNTGSLTPGHSHRVTQHRTAGRWAGRADRRRAAGAGTAGRAVAGGGCGAAPDGVGDQRYGAHVGAGREATQAGAWCAAVACRHRCAGGGGAGGR